MSRPPRLTRAAVVEAAAELVTRAPAGADITLAQLGRRLGVDATAFYRHFRDKGELMRAVGDHILGGITVDLPPPSADWRATVTTICVRLRAAHLAQPRLAELVRDGPPLNPNEFAITERLLVELRAAGLRPRPAVQAYHALIELTIGSAALDAKLVGSDPVTRAATYEGWRSAYRLLDPARYPTAVKLADRLYEGDAGQRYRYALDRLLDGIAGSVP